MEICSGLTFELSLNQIWSDEQEYQIADLFAGIDDSHLCGLEV